MSRRSGGQRIGSLRPSQLLQTFGVGSVIELPKLSVLVMGLDDWQIEYSTPINEPRLLNAVRQRLGRQVNQLLTPPLPEDSAGLSPTPNDDAARIGVPVAPFPRWLVCPACRLLAPIGSGLFVLKEDAYRPDRTTYVHGSCNKMTNPEVIPARFVVACENGHFDDFPWVEFVHRGASCEVPVLSLTERGTSGEAVDVRVACRGQNCKASRTMAEAFSQDMDRTEFNCTGRRPHLRDYDSDRCDQRARRMLLGASNQWFALSLTALSLPSGQDKLGQLVEEQWAALGQAESKQNIALLRGIGALRAFAEFSDDEIWREVERKKQGSTEPETDLDLKPPEWRLFSRPQDAPRSENFQLTETDVPEGFSKFIERVVLVERLREVRSLLGFTRIDYPADGVPQGDEGLATAPLSRGAPRWVPACEVRGEGVFLQFNEEEVSGWVAGCGEIATDFLTAHRAWRRRRKLDPDIGFPGMRFVLLHSISHALIRQLALESGYATASIRERIYSRDATEEGGAMAGILLYTAAPDSEGTLGGLVSLGRPKVLTSHLRQALEGMRLCPSDPLCCERIPSSDGLALHGAACHACMFASETSCERGNRYLDRSVLVETLERRGWSFFGE